MRASITCFKNAEREKLSLMSQLIMVSRAFENISALMKDSDDSLKSAIQTLGGSK